MYLAAKFHVLSGSSSKGHGMPWWLSSHFPQQRYAMYWGYHFQTPKHHFCCLFIYTVSPCIHDPTICWRNSPCLGKIPLPCKVPGHLETEATTGQAAGSRRERQWRYKPLETEEFLHHLGTSDDPMTSGKVRRPERIQQLHGHPRYIGIDLGYRFGIGPDPWNEIPSRTWWDFFDLDSIWVCFFGAHFLGKLGDDDCGFEFSTFNFLATSRPTSQLWFGEPLEDTSIWWNPNLLQIKRTAYRLPIIIPIIKMIIHWDL